VKRIERTTPAPTPRYRRLCLLTGMNQRCSSAQIDRIGACDTARARSAVKLDYESADVLAPPVHLEVVRRH
jgi:hypothetical protein